VFGIMTGKASIRGGGGREKFPSGGGGIKILPGGEKGKKGRDLSQAKPSQGGNSREKSRDTPPMQVGGGKDFLVRLQEMSFLRKGGKKKKNS